MANIYSFSCTRSSTLSSTSKRLEKYLDNCGIIHKWIIGSKSIFTSYSKAITNLNPKDDDIIILCHDDIDIWDDPNELKEQLKLCLQKDVGFVGVVGTTHLAKDAVWWEANRRQEGLHRGFCFQGDNREVFYPNYFGPNGRVVVLDGLFLAASGKTLKDLNLVKPGYFPGNWDFYDIHYTTQTHKMGLKNMTIPIHVLHNSNGEMIAGRGWAENRKAFQSKESLPFII